MLKLLDISFANIGRFDTEQFIDFTGREKLIQIDAENENTGGSSGSGKTTIIQAILYLLDLKSTPATILQSRYSKSPMWVRGRFDKDGTTYTITRSKKDGYTIEWEDIVIGSNNKQAEEKLAEIIYPLDKNLFRKMILKPQKEPYFFLNLSSGEMYKFLITVLGLEKFLLKEEEIANDIKGINDNISTIDSHLLAQEASIAETQQLILGYSEKPSNDGITIETIRNLKSNLQTIRSQKEQMITNKTKELSLLVEPVRAPVVTFNTTTLTQLKTQLTNVLTQKSNIERGYQQSKQQIQTNINQLNAKQYELTQNINQEINNIKQVINNDILQLKHQSSDLQKEFDANTVVTKHQLEQQKSTLQTKLTEIDNVQKLATKLAIELKTSQKEQAEVEKSMCPTCHQTWVGEQAVAKIEVLKKQQSDLMTQILSYKDLITSRDVVSNQLNEITANLMNLTNTCEYSDRYKILQANIIGIDSQIQQLELSLQTQLTNEAIDSLNISLLATTKQIQVLEQQLISLQNDITVATQIQDCSELINEITLKITQEEGKKLNLESEANVQYQESRNVWLISINNIETKYATVINDFDIQIRDLEQAISESELKLANYNTNIVRYEANLKQLNDVLITKKQTQAKLIKTSQTKRQELLIVQEARRLIKTYLLQVFQGTLDTIGDVATGILNNIPNTATTTIYFEGCKENKDGSLRDEITAYINSDGEDNIPIKSLSGGEETSLGLAIDLAVIDVIEARSGVGTSFLILDEPFDGLESINRIGCLKMLEKFETNKNIIIIDHCSELKAKVSDCITVVRNGLTSVIK